MLEMMRGQVDEVCRTDNIPGRQGLQERMSGQVDENCRRDVIRLVGEVC